MALAASRRKQVGHTDPRLAPPVPARSLIAEYEAAAKTLGISLMPWQRVAARYMTATIAKHWRYRSVCIVVARQNGKTELLLPRILMGLMAGRRMLHTAQNRSIPRETFMRLSRALNGHPDVRTIRFASGEETIEFANGGRYTLVAPRPGVRGHSMDDVFIDEVREQRSFDLMAGIKPTLTASRDPQIVYLSNAGDVDSVVLNDLRRKADSERSLAYLEWSAAPGRELDDRAGWAEANPALGLTIDVETLEDFHATFPPPVWETEHLCRWVVSMQPSLVSEAAWLRARGDLEPPRRPAMALSMFPSGKRASAVIAWQQSDGTVACRVLADVTGDPVPLEEFGPALRAEAGRVGVGPIAFDPWTDADLARQFSRAKPLVGREWANASENFVRVVESGRLHWDGSDAMTADLAWMSRKPHESGAWQAVPANDDHPVTAALAAVRAVWLASGPARTGRARIY